MAPVGNHGKVDVAFYHDIYSYCQVFSGNNDEYRNSLELNTIAVP